MYSGVRELEIKTSRSITKKALSYIKKNKAGEELVFTTRFPDLNKALLGGFRMGNYVVVAGASGHGKSYLLAEFVEDIMNRDLNPTDEDIKVLHFGFDMPARSEIIRSIAARMNKSYGDLVSAEFELSDEDYAQVELIAEDQFMNKEVYYIDVPGSKEEIKHTVYGFAQRFPNSRLIVTLDHSLLVEYSTEKGEIELVSKISKTLKALRQELGVLVILLSQLNDKIEDPRRKDPSHHYPTKTDLHGSKAVYQDSDVVMVLHRPELMGLDTYGRNAYPTKNLAALHIIKNRDMHQGLVLLKEDLAHARFLPYTVSYGI
jgi:replicative DNA helicase